ncbi:MAG: hypothetical protein ACYCWW_20385, partial [Deltaproteobacteria bacterium]
AEDRPRVASARPSDRLDAAFEALPEFLRRRRQGGGLPELAFLRFLAELHRSGGLGGPALEARNATLALRATGRALLELPGGAELGLVAQSSRCIVALRRETQVAYRLLEGIDGCPRCELAKGMGDAVPRAREHHRLRGVAVTDAPGEGPGWIELPRAHLLAIDRALSPRVEPV